MSFLQIPTQRITDGEQRLCTRLFNHRKYRTCGIKKEMRIYHGNGTPVSEPNRKRGLRPYFVTSEDINSAEERAQWAIRHIDAYEYSPITFVSEYDFDVSSVSPVDFTEPSDKELDFFESLSSPGALYDAVLLPHLSGRGNAVIEAYIARKDELILRGEDDDSLRSCTLEKLAALPPSPQTVLIAPRAFSHLSYRSCRIYSCKGPLLVKMENGESMDFEYYQKTAKEVEEDGRGLVISPPAYDSAEEFLPDKIPILLSVLLRLERHYPSFTSALHDYYISDAYASLSDWKDRTILMLPVHRYSLACLELDLTPIPYTPQKNEDNSLNMKKEIIEYVERKILASPERSVAGILRDMNL